VIEEAGRQYQMGLKAAVTASDSFPRSILFNGPSAFVVGIIISSQKGPL
jgi:hypothetical protein